MVLNYWHVKVQIMGLYLNYGGGGIPINIYLFINVIFKKPVWFCAATEICFILSIELLVDRNTISFFPLPPKIAGNPSRHFNNFF